MKNQRDHHARYIGELAYELAKMARTDGLEVLAYLLEMTNLEANSAGKESHDNQRD